MSDIGKQEAIDIMTRCKADIAALRAQVEHLQPKADAYDNIAAILRMLPQPSMVMGEDLVWRLDKRICELKEPLHD